MLNDIVVLVCEDEPFIAMELALTIEDAGGIVVGPAADIQTALALLAERPINAAILDFNLTDGDITPVADRLQQAGIPFIIQSGIGLSSVFVARFPGLVFRLKPSNSIDLVSDLRALISDTRQSDRD